MGKADVSYFQLNLAELKEQTSQGKGEDRLICALIDLLLLQHEILQ